ncbi:hypothetical protein SAMCFNEI73_Ch3237 [Sinorhizobium americanum]|uniref:Uncharacterized protein n=1 Tax=Sinorhizobium americanum TaxID=194963 RepID=A0A1L3LQY0_9HYPH|nr:hypothetical protein SAMCCGM7_Ch3114 [Sinorhizobium americanum CCGM7]APG92500.1 hypothetical protein SAMCFNEI73_Ch3237 [Sinorhizobium americanum]
MWANRSAQPANNQARFLASEAPAVIERENLGAIYRLSANLIAIVSQS